MVHDVGAKQTRGGNRIVWAVAIASLVALLGMVASTTHLLGVVAKLDERVINLTTEVQEFAHSLDRHTEKLEEARSEVTALQADSTSLSIRLMEIEQLREERTDLTALAAELRESVVIISMQNSIGSGFPIENRRGDIVIITNYHVVEQVWTRGGRDVEIRSGDTSYPGRIVAVHPSSDLAAIESNQTGRKPIPVRTSAPVVGETVIAVGSPLGFEGTVSTGIVSGIRDEWVQFTAQVGQGNSGGPLVDESGRVIGVVTWGTRAGFAEGISFAAPMEIVCSTVTSCRGSE